MKILALMLAGGEGSRLRPLTANHAKPALRFVNGYRIVDFVLSNLINSGIASIYVQAQYKPQSLIEHVGAAWAPAQTGGGFVNMVLPEAGLARGPFLGTADAVHKNLHLFLRHAPDLVTVFAADHGYRMNVGQMVDSHAKSKTDISVAAVPVPIESASHFGVIATRADGRIRELRRNRFWAAHPAARGRDAPRFRVRLRRQPGAGDAAARGAQLLARRGNDRGVQGGATRCIGLQPENQPDQRALADQWQNARCRRRTGCRRAMTLTIEEQTT